MPSLKYKMTERLFFHTVKSIMGDSKAAFVDYVFSMASKRKLEAPSGRWQSSYGYEEVEDGETTLFKIRPKKKAPTGLVLYLTGDGLFQPPALADFELCGDLVDHTDKEIWLLSYPLIPTAGPRQIMETVMETYTQAAGKYAPDQISVMGLSSGCSLAMGICFKLLESGRGQLLPGCLILQSPPLRIPPSPAQKEQMRQIEARDPVFTADYYSYLLSIADYSDCEYLLCPLDRDLAGFPPLYVFMGEYETASAYLQELTDKCAADRVALTVETGPQMMHNWCLLGNTPEAGKVRRRFYEILTSSI